MRLVTAALVPLALLAAVPVLAQEPVSQKVNIGFSTGYVSFGPIVPEVTHHVRLGNMGQDQYFQVDVDKPLGKKLGLIAALVVAPTQLYQWPKTTEIGRMWRPNVKWQQLNAYNTTWSCATVGLRHRPVGWLEGNAGTGICSVSGASYQRFGAAPMVAGTLQFGAHLMKRVTEGLVLDASCTAYPSYSSRATGQPYAVYRDHAGYEDFDSGFWVVPIKCGAGLRVGM